MSAHHQRTGHGTDIYIPREEDDATHVDVFFYDPASGFGDDGAAVLSLTPEEARRLGDALLSSSQRVEDKQPHGNS